MSFNLIPDTILGHDRRNGDDVLSDVVRGHDPLLEWGGGGDILENSRKQRLYLVNILSLTPSTWE